MKQTRIFLPFSALKLTGLYLVFGIIWIIISDRIVEGLAYLPTTVTQLQTIKGSVFIIGSALFIFGLIRTRENQTKAYEAALERQIDLYDKAQDIANLGAWEYDTQTEGGGGGWTDQASRIHGLAPDVSLSPKRSLESYHPEDRPTIAAAFERAVTEGEAYDLEVRFIDANDEHRWVRTMGEPQYEDGELVRVRGTLQDITDRKEREQELRRFRQAANSAGHAVYFTDPDGVIEYVNQAFESITGYSANDAVGYNPRILKSGEMSDGYYEDLWGTVLNGDVWEEEVINRRKDGELYTAHQTIAPIKDDDEIDGFVAIQTDISDQKALEADLKTSLTQLKVMDRVLRHNLRNDMTVIKGNAEIILATSDGDVADIAEIIIEKSDKLHTTAEKERMITNVLVNEQSPESIDIGVVINNTVAATREQYPEAQISVEGTTGRQVRALASINRALTELLTNAAIHSDQTNPSIEVTIKDRDKTVAVLIADDGPGISDMEREIITEEANIEPLYHGTGLGLWLVKMIVENSGGSLAFNENEPRGSIVTITLPVAPAGGANH